MTTLQFGHQVGHLHRRDRGLETFVAHLRAGALYRLLDRLRGYDPEDYGHPAGDVIEVGRCAPDHSPQTDDGVVASGEGQLSGDYRYLVGTWHPHYVNGPGVATVASDRLDSPFEQGLYDEVVETRGDYPEGSPPG